MQFSPHPVTSFLLGSNILIRSFVLEASLFYIFSPTMRNHASQAYKTTGKIIAVFCTFLSLG
jgi:hypothetical protein